MNTYPFDQPIVLEAAFAVEGVATDPDAITLVIKQPDGTRITKTEADLANPSEGTWNYEFLPTQSGEHWYGFKWPGESAEQTNFNVERSNL